MKFIEARIEEAPEKWIERIVMSTAGLGCPISESGG